MVIYHHDHSKMCWKFLIHQNHFQDFISSRASMLFRVCFNSEFNIIRTITLSSSIFMLHNASQESIIGWGSLSHPLDSTRLQEMNLPNCLLQKNASQNPSVTNIETRNAASVIDCCFNALINLVRFIPGAFDGDNFWIFIHFTTVLCDVLLSMKNYEISYEKNNSNRYRIL